MTINPTPAQPLARLLLVQPNFEQLHPLIDALRQENYCVAICSTTSAALAQVRRLDFGVLLIDLRTAQPDHVRLLQQIRRANPQVHVIVCPPRATPAEIEAALDSGAFAVVEEVAGPEEVVKQVHRAFRDHYLQQLARRIENRAN